MKITKYRLAAFAILASASVAVGGPIATGNASGGALPIITPAPTTSAPAPQPQAAAPAPAPSTFIHGYMSSFGR